MVDFQQAFLTELKNQKIRVKILFTRGDSVEGQIIAFDPYAIVLKDGSKNYLVFKNNITFIEPIDNFSFDSGK